MNDLLNNWQSVLSKIRQAAVDSNRKFEDIKVIAVSKTKPIEMLFEASEIGIKIFGENYSQEMQSKFQEYNISKYPQPEWHYIGTLQRNNVKNIAPFVDLIHSIDSVKLALEIDKRAAENNRIIDCLIQVNTSAEYTKSGEDPEQILSLTKDIIDLKNINLKGVMTIGSFTDNPDVSKKEFDILKECLKEINSEMGLDLKEISMGMSHDYELAIKEGATMVRIGSAIFGNRNYI